jgi:hypothetical protein
MAMPKTAIHKKRCFPLWENEIRSAWQIFPKESKSQSSPMGDAPDDKLWPGVLTSRCSHSGPAFFCVYACASR